MGKSARDKRDIFYRLAKEQGWRARSAFKLLQIDNQFNIFKGVNMVVDLCAAPGGWTQVLSKKLGYKNNEAKIVAVDLQAMSPLDKVVQIQGDITSRVTVHKILNSFQGNKADLVVCDGAPDVIGLHELDEFIQAQLVLSAFKITSQVLRTGGNFIAKVFRGKDVHLVYRQLKCFFEVVILTKPQCSRNSSIESFIYCNNFNGITKLDEIENIFKKETNEYFQNLNKELQNPLVPFVACSVLDGYDADRNYSLECLNTSFSTYTYKAPIQLPIKPPYEEANKLRKNNKFDKKISN